MSVSFHFMSQESVNSKYSVEVITISSDDDSKAVVDPMESPKATKTVVAGGSGIKTTPTKIPCNDAEDAAYYKGATPTAKASKKRSFDTTNGVNKKHGTTSNEAAVIIKLDTTDEGSD